MNNNIKANPYKWYILLLAAFTNAIAVAIPSMSMTVLLPEISKDLNLTLVQAGWVWGIISLPAIITGLIGGALGDRFGPKRILTYCCLLIGIASALRGTATDFFSLVLLSLMYGVLTPVITMNNLKTAGIWFPEKELGLASGVQAMGMACGCLISSTISATVVSPWLGGWQNVFFFYGAITVLLFIPWFFTKPGPVQVQTPEGTSKTHSIVKGMLHVARLKNIWLLGLAMMGVNGAIQGLQGYLPMYLRSMHWTTANADGTLGVLYTVSLIFVLPLTFWSDRLDTRKKPLLVTGSIVFMGIAFLSFVQGNLVWLAVIFIGLVRDGFMAILLAWAIEMKGVGAAYSGTATGFVMIFIGLGNLLAPPTGNSFAGITAGSPFVFWALMAIMGVVCVSMINQGKLIEESPIR